MPLRTRLLWIVAAIAVYVPLAGGGPSIVRAGVMGALTLLATFAGRRASRLYALAIAVVVTLAIDPRIGADVGWQLSFAAVLGILVIAGPLRKEMARRLGSGGLRSALAEGVAVTVAATLATAPLIAFHFGELSTVSLFANLLALPAVAPAMWLCMLTAIGAQVPGFPASIPNAIAAPLLAYIAAVASWCARPRWALLEVEMGIRSLLASYLALAGAVIAIPTLVRRRRIAALRRTPGPGNPERNVFRPPRSRKTLHRRWGVLVVAVVLLVSVVLVHLGAAAGESSAPPIADLRINVLDVGQGDAILLRPATAPPILIDGGPPGDDLIAELDDAGVDSLGIAVVTHEQSDHAGGIEELLERHFPIGHLLYARLGRRLRGEAEAAGAGPVRVGAGDTIGAGRLRLSVLWPRPGLLDQPLAGADPNSQALVLLVRWRWFSMLLTADAEAGEVPIDPGPIDVLKVAHHGSEDTGLGALLDRTSPRLAVISVGADNPYGHPAPSTLAELAQHEVQTLRTDRRGTIELDVDQNSFVVRAGDG